MLSFRMNIHPATEYDLDSVISWVSTEEDCRIWAGPAVTFPLEKITLINEICFGPDNSYICKNGSDSLAFGQIFKLNKGYSHIARVITNPSYRRRGFGREICNTLVNYASMQGGDGISLNVYRNNLPALRLYQSMGFNEQIEKSDVNNVFMVKT